MKINEALGLLTSVYIDWAHVLANPNGIRKNSQITWNNYIPQMLKLPIMISDVIDLSNKSQYTFQVIIDGSLIQIYYQYDTRGNEVKSAHLAFYSSASYGQLFDKNKNVLQLPATFQADLETEDSPDADILSGEYGEEPLDIPRLGTLSDEPVSWLRIDYDPAHARGVLHHDCHMHLSAFPHARLVVAGVPTPKQFIEFIMALCYPEVYRAHRLDHSGGYINVNQLITINSKKDYIFRQMIHLRIPVISEGRGC